LNERQGRPTRVVNRKEHVVPKAAPKQEQVAVLGLRAFDDDMDLGAGP
jgi:hypothetical protein